MTQVRTYPLVIRAALVTVLALSAAACGDNIKHEPSAVADATKSTVVVEPETARADGVEYVIIRVTVADGAGAPLAGMGVSIDASGDGNTITQPPALTGSDGVALGSITSTIAGVKEIQVTAGAVQLTQKPTATFTAVASQLAFVTQPRDGVAGELLDPVVQVAIQDNAGTTMADVTGPVTLALKDNPGDDHLRGTVTVDAVDGIATFDNVRVLHAAAGYTLVATADGMGSAVSDPFSIVPAVPTRLGFVQQPTDVVAGEAIAPAVTVSAWDLFDNVASNFTAAITIGVSTNPSGGTLSGTLVRQLVDGVATFHDLSLDRTGEGYTLVAAIGALPQVESAPFNVGAAAVASLQVVGLADPFIAGHTGVIVVSARDQLGNIIPDFAQTVHFTSGDAQAVLPADYTFVADDNGWHAFTGVSLRTAGVQTITVTSTSDATIKGSRSVQVMPAPVSALAFTVQPSNGTAAIALTPAVKVTLRDEFGNTATESDLPVTLTIASGPAGATIVGGGPRPPGTQGGVPSDAGVVTFPNVILDKAGSYTLQATAPLITPTTSTAFTIVAGAAAVLGFVVEPSNVEAGASVAPAIQVGIFDASGNLATTATSAITLAIASGPTGAALTGLGPSAAVAGVATFAAVQGTTSGSYTLQATSGALTAATSSSFDIGPAPSGKLAFLTGPANAVAGAMVSPTVTVAIQDQYGNLVPTATTPVTLEIVSGPTGAVLFGAGPNAAVAGVASFPLLSIQAAGSYTIRATAPGSLVSSASTQFTISPAALAGLGFVTQPTGALPGETLSPAVTVALQDRFGNTVDASTPTIGLTLSGGNPSAALTGGAAVAPVNGIATFAGLSIDKSGGSYMLVAAHVGLTTGYSSPFSIFGAPDHVAFTVQPHNTSLGAAFTVAAAIQDNSNATLTIDNTSQIALAIGTNPGGATLSGTTTLTVVNGVATFAGLALSATGNGYTLIASSGSLTSATSTAFTIFGPATKLVFTTQPPTTVAINTAFSVKVTVEDSSGRRVENATPDITLALSADSPAATLAGTLTRTAVAGEVTFPGLALDATGLAFMLTASGMSLDGSSSRFDVYTTPGANELMITEVMSNTGGDRLRQWFEIKNVTDKVLAIDNLRIEENVTDPTPVDVDSPAVISPKHYFVFGASNAPADNGGVTTIDYVYPTTFNLGDGTGGDLIVSLAGTVITELSWSTATWPHTADHAMNLSSKAQHSDGYTYSWWWCDAVASLSGTGYGTPGADNDACGVDPQPPLDSCALVGTMDRLAHPGVATTFLAQFSEATITDRNTCGNDVYPWLGGEFGYGPTSDPAGWTWVAADFDNTYTPATCPSSLDQKTATTTFAAGSYYFGYRITFVDPDTQTGDWYYCDRTGIAATPASGSYGTLLVAPACTGTSQVVISQVYGGGGLTGASYLNDFVELHNRGLTPVTITNWSVQYASATGSGNFGGSASQLAVIAAATIPAGGYLLVQGKSAGAVGLPLPGADFTNANMDLSGTNGKVALVKQATTLGCNGGSTPCTPTQLALIADLVGYGNANFSEGSAPVGALSVTTAAVRKDADGSASIGCVDTDNNLADFAVAAPNPRWSGSAVANCGCFLP